MSAASAPAYCRLACKLWRRLYKRHRKAEKARQPRVRVKPMIGTIAGRELRRRDDPTRVYFAVKAQEFERDFGQPRTEHAARAHSKWANGGLGRFREPKGGKREYARGAEQ